MSNMMYTSTNKVVRWPKIECPNCGHKYSFFQGGVLETQHGKRTSSRKWLKCVKCDCEYNFTCPDGVVKIGDR